MISTHTLTWSVTDAIVEMNKSYDDFNSHAHVERDSTARLAEKTSLISTHTLTWSVTAHLRFKKHSIWISTHTLTWSVTRLRTCFPQGLNISTHTLTWSVTLGF